MEVPKSLMREKKEKGRANFDRIEFSLWLFASKMSASTNQIHH